MEILGNKMSFTAEEVETYGIDNDGTLTITLKEDLRANTALHWDEQEQEPEYDEEADAELPLTEQTREEVDTTKK